MGKKGFFHAIGTLGGIMEPGDWMAFVGGLSSAFLSHRFFGRKKADVDTAPTAPTTAQDHARVAGEHVGIWARKKFLLDRDDFRAWLKNHPNEGGHILVLLDVMNRGAEVLHINGRDYTEDDVFSVLLGLEPEAVRLTNVIDLNGMLGRDDREAFFAGLETLTNDGHINLVRKLKAKIKRHGGDMDALLGLTASDLPKIETANNVLRQRIASRKKGFWRC